MEIKPTKHETKLICNFALWAYALALRGNHKAKMANCAAQDLIAEMGKEAIDYYEYLVQTTDFSKAGPERIASEFFEDPTLLDSEFLNKVAAWEAVERHVKPRALKDVAGNCLVEIAGKPLPVDQFGYDALVAAKRGLAI